MPNYELFNRADALATLRELPATERDALDFGVIEVDAGGVVRSYSRWEREFSGLEEDTVKGSNFFVDVAPCTNNFMFAERYLIDNEVDETFDYVFTFKMKPTKVTVRLLRSAKGGFILVRRR